jgi:hypothetical protein
LAVEQLPKPALEGGRSVGFLSSWCFNNTKNRYPELRFRALLTKDGARQIELVRS